MVAGLVPGSIPGSTDCKARPAIVTDPTNEDNYDSMIQFGAARALTDGPMFKQFYLCKKLTVEQVCILVGLFKIVWLTKQTKLTLNW